MADSSNLTDEKLVEITRTQNHEMYSEIIRRYQQKLSHYLRKFVHNNDELEDVLQDVFIKTFRNLNAFDITKRFSPWIYRIAHNEAINFLNKHRKRTISLDQEELQIIDADADIKQSVDAVLNREAIENALSKLKANFRETLILYFFEQKTYEEISDILHMPISSVGTLIRRGKIQLKELLKKYDRQ